MFTSKKACGGRGACFLTDGPVHCDSAASEFLRFKIKRAACAALAFIVLLSGISGCTNKRETSDDEDAKITDKNITLTYWVVNDMSQSVSDYAENACYKELEKRTGIKIRFLHPTGNWWDQLSLMIASKDLPDIIETKNVDGLPGGADQCIEDGIIIRLNELIDQYAPNYKKAREMSDESKMLTMTDKGNIYAFSKLLNDEEESWSGPKVRVDLLEKLNLEVPQTIDDWYNMLKAFKADGIMIPFSLDYPGWDTTAEFGAFVGAFGVNKTFYKGTDGKIHYGPIEPGYLEFLQTFSKWYAEGLIDPEFATRSTESRNQLGAEGMIGSGVSAPFGKYKVKAAPYPSKTRGEKVRFRQKNWRNRGYEAVITTANKYPIETVKWFDYHYSPNGSKLFDYGIEGLNYTWIDGHPIVTDLVRNDPLGYWGALNKYKVDNAPYIKDVHKILAPSLDKVVNEDNMVWFSASADGMLPKINLNSKERARYNEIMNQVQGYVEKMYVEFITGRESIDKWDSYVNEVKKMGIEEAVTIMQQAYDRMLARVNMR